MIPADLAPAVLLYYDRDGQLQRAETNAAPFDCDSAFHAADNLAAGKPALVLADDVDAVLAEMRRRETIG